MIMTDAASNIITAATIQAVAWRAVNIDEADQEVFFRTTNIGRLLQELYMSGSTISQALDIGKITFRVVCMAPGESMPCTCDKIPNALFVVNGLIEVETVEGRQTFKMLDLTSPEKKILTAKNAGTNEAIALVIWK